MIGLDATMLLRLMTDGDPAQSVRVARFIQQTPPPFFVSQIALVQLVWALEHASGYSRAQIAAALDALLDAPELRMEGEAEIYAALEAHRAGADFADALTAAAGRKAGCAQTMTLDPAAAHAGGGLTALK